MSESISDTDLQQIVTERRSAGLSWREIRASVGDVVSVGTLFDIASGNSVTIETANKVREALGLPSLGEMRLVRPDEEVRKLTKSQRRRRRLRRELDRLGWTRDDAIEYAIEMRKREEAVCE